MLDIKGQLETADAGKGCPFLYQEDRFITRIELAYQSCRF